LTAEHNGSGQKHERFHINEAIQAENHYLDVKQHKPGWRVVQVMPPSVTCSSNKPQHRVYALPIQHRNIDMTRIIKTIMLTLCVVIALPVKADPVIAIASLILAQKIVHPKHKPQLRNTTRWRELLNVNEKKALDKIRSHPAIHACLERANQNHPVATYHLRKIARFSALVQEKQTRSGEMPVLANMKYRWPAKGFQWCKKQVGITATSDEGSLKTAARQLADLSNSYSNELMVAMSH
jgi:hypothetical protein